MVTDKTKTPGLVVQVGRKQTEIRETGEENLAMMTVECKINIDWIEDGSIDEIIQNRITEEVVATIKAAIAGKVDVLAVDILNTRVNAMLDEIWENFMEKRVNITDKYGDPVESHESIKDMLKAKLDDFVNQRVDSNGQPYPPSKSCPHGAKPRLEHLMAVTLSAHTKTFIDQVQRDFEFKLKETLNAKLKEAISSSMLKAVNIGEILKQQSAGA